MRRKSKPPFFFKAKDGIRDPCVTGVQTCALPISSRGFDPGARPYLCPTQYAGRAPGSKPRLAAKNGDPLFQFANLSSFAEKMLCPERSLVKIRDRKSVV